MLLRTIGQLAERERARTLDQTPEPPPPASRIPGATRLVAEVRVDEALARRPLRRLLFNWVLGQARARVRDRENLRFERTRVFGRVRRIFVEAGKRLAGEGLLARPATSSTSRSTKCWA